MSWNLKGDYAESCNCDLMCPCIFLQAPTKGFCEAMLVWDIKEGHLGDVKLDGLKVSAWLHAPAVLTEGGFQLALYVDENASDAQHDASLGRHWQLPNDFEQYTVDTNGSREQRST